jgi:hypothetical protein
MACRPQPSAKYQFSKNFDIRILFSTLTKQRQQRSTRRWNSFRCLFVLSISRLRDVILTDARLYLIFEYLAMDLKKYLDCLAETEEMNMILIRVRSTLVNSTEHSLFIF